MRIFTPLLLSFLVLGASSNALGKKYRVVATTTMVADMVRAIAEPEVAVKGLMAPGVDPHLYRPTAREIVALNKASIIFYSGLSLEGRMEEVFEKLKKRGRRVVAITDSLQPHELLAPADFAGHWDPHVWGDAQLWSHCIPLVAKQLKELAPEHASLFDQRAAAYEKELVALHEWAFQQVATLHPTHRVLITSHDAFNYFGRAYGLKVVGVQGISTASEAGLADIAATVDYIKKKKVKAIFVESSVSPAAIERIAQDAKIKIGGELFSDATGEPGQKIVIDGATYDVSTYQGMLRHNIHTIVTALR